MSDQQEEQEQQQEEEEEAVEEEKGSGGSRGQEMRRGAHLLAERAGQHRHEDLQRSHTQSTKETKVRQVKGHVFLG
jgi:hypothetical protein